MGNQTYELFPSVLKKRIVLVWTVVLPMALVAVLNGFVCWLTWNELGTPRPLFGMKDVPVAPRVLLLAAVLAALVPALVAAGGAMAMLRRRWARDIPVWLQVALGGWCGAFFLAVRCSGCLSGLENDLSRVMNQESFLSAQWVCVMPCVFLGLWRLAGVPRRDTVSDRWDMLDTLSAIVVPPVIMFVGLHILFFVFADGVKKPWHDTFIDVCIVGTILLFVVMFAGVLRLLLWLRVLLAEKMRKWLAGHADWAEGGGIYGKSDASA